MNCSLSKCSLNHPDAPRIKCTNEQHGNLAEPTRESTKALLDDYDNRIQCLQAARANVQRTMDTLPVEVRPEILAALHKRSELLADIEQVVQRCHRPDDTRQCGQALLEYIQARPNLFTGIRF